MQILYWLNYWLVKVWRKSLSLDVTLDSGKKNVDDTCGKESVKHKNMSIIITSEKIEIYHPLYVMAL